MSNFNFCRGRGFLQTRLRPRVALPRWEVSGPAVAPGPHAKGKRASGPEGLKARRVKIQNLRGSHLRSRGLKYFNNKSALLRRYAASSVIHSEPPVRRTRRKPTLLYRSTGVNPSRYADRTYHGMPLQLPPRNTRRDPPPVYIGLFLWCFL